MCLTPNWSVTALVFPRLCSRLWPAVRLPLFDCEIPLKAVAAPGSFGRAVLAGRRSAGCGTETLTAALLRCRCPALSPDFLPARRAEGADCLVTRKPMHARAAGALGITVEFAYA
jgi:hypothetical protein